MAKIEVKELENGKVEMRGFILEDSGEWFLYPQPALKSCCSSGNLNEGVLLTGKVPYESKGRLVSIVGYFDGNLRVTETKENLSYAAYIGPLVALICLVMLGLWYRSAQK